jgi:hypothetical protein
MHLARGRGILFGSFLEIRFDADSQTQGRAAVSSFSNY